VSGSARSAGVAYVDLAVGDTKALVSGITDVVKDIAKSAQKELSKAFTLNSDGSFQNIVDAASDAAEAAGKSIAEGIADGAEAAAEAVSETISHSVSSAAADAASALISTMAEAGTQAGEQLALNFEDAAAENFQLFFFDADDLAAQAAAAGREAGEALTESLQESTADAGASLGSVFGSIGLQGIVSDVQGVATKSRNILTDAFAKAGYDGGESMKESVSEFGKGISYSVGTWGVGMAVGMALTKGVSSAFDAVKSSVIDFNSEMQSAQISFTTLLGSASKATTMISQIKQFSLGTPYQFEDLTEDAQELLALGVNAQSIIPDLTGLGDAVSAIGGDSSTLDSVVQVFGEMQSKGQIMETQLRELEIRGIPALQILAAGYGVTTAQMAKNITAGKVMATQALPMLIKGIEQGTKSTKAMGGEMAAQSKTFAGSLSNIKDGVTQFAAGAFRPVFTTLNGLSARFAGFASSSDLQKMVTPIAATVSEGIGDVRRYIGELVNNLRPAEPLVKSIASDFGRFSILRSVLGFAAPLFQDVAQAIGAIGHNHAAVDIISALVKGFLLFRSVGMAANATMLIFDELADMNPLGQLVLGVSAVVIGFTALYQHSKTFRDIVGDIGSFFGAVWHGILVAFNVVKGALITGFDFIRSHLYVLFAAGPIGMVALFVIEVVKHFGILEHGVMDAVHAVGSVLGWLWGNVVKPVFDAISFGVRLLAVIVGTLLGAGFLIAYHIIAPMVLTLWHDIFEPAFHGIGELATWLWSHAIGPAFKWIGGLFTNFGGSVVKPLWNDVFGPTFRAIGDSATWLYRQAIAPAFSLIGTVATWLYSNAIAPVGSAITDALNAVGTAAMWLWVNAFDPAFSAIGSAADWLWSNAISPVFNLIGDIAQWLWNTAVKPAFDELNEGFQTVATWAEWLYDNGIKPVFHTIDSVITTTMTDVKSAFSTAVSGISSLWGSLQKILAVPLNYIVNTVYTRGIREVWDFIADKVNIPELPPAPHFAGGGVIPGQKSQGDWVPFYGTAGEGILTLSEMSALGGERGFNALRGVLGGGSRKGSSDGHYGLGGILSGIGHLVSSGANLVSAGVGDLTHFAGSIVAGGLKDAASAMLAPVKAGLNDVMPGNSVLKQMMVGVPQGMINGVLSYFGGQDKTADAKMAAQSGGAITAQIMSWIAQAEQITGVGGSWTSGLATIIAHESGGNVMAENLSDSNAKAGDPSRGLMQTIMSTFEAYRSMALPDNIFDGLANIVAGINYIKARYHSIANVPGLVSLAGGGPYVGYASGTGGAAKGWAWVGEQGPELVNFGGGETVLNHQDSMSMHSQVSSGYATGTKTKRLTADQVYTVDTDAVDLELASLTASSAKTLINTLNKLILGVTSNSRALGIVHADSVAATKLANLATQKANIASTITTATSYAASLTSNAASFGDLSGLSLSGISGVGSIISGLQSNDSQLKSFVSDMGKLRRLGYSSAVIQQIAAMGPSDGAVYAEALASASSSQASQVNSLLNQVSAETTTYGQSIADDLYDSGADAGKGFLSGLKSQEAAIAAEMKSIADTVVGSVKKELKIHSPSQRLHDEVGLMTGMGIETGMDASIPGIESAAKRLGVAAAKVPVPTPTASYGSYQSAAQAAAAGAPYIDVKVLLDGQELDARMEIKIDQNNRQLVRALNGGRTG
jgi:tape measure domain-containing protein